jgi:hypothetical protein
MKKPTMVKMIMQQPKIELEEVGMMRDPMKMLDGKKGREVIVTTMIVMVREIGLITEDLEGQTIIEVIVMVEMEIGFSIEDQGDPR